MTQGAVSIFGNVENSGIFQVNPGDRGGEHEDVQIEGMKLREGGVGGE